LRSAGIGVESVRLTDHNRTRVIRIWNTDVDEAEQAWDDLCAAVSPF
jgi:hypothetical protein